ncbi:MAG: hypothetical protein M1816_000497 [Peltula sp. TS41687]|nr:MAG: hypothetical protein M1816_000497 [Peltula sp. TS41687]
MRLRRRPAASPYCLFFLTFAVLISISLAQNTPNSPDAKPASSAAPTTGRASPPSTSALDKPASIPASASTPPAATPGSTKSSDSPAPTSDSESESSPASTSEDSEKPSEISSLSRQAPVTITPTGAVSTTQAAPPSITGSGSAAPTLPKNLPTLSGAYSYPPPSIPPTAHAPFMQRSTLPEGTVFIIVGAALGFFAFSVLAWRLMVAWSVRRSVKRAAAQSNVSDAKVRLQPRGSGFYATGAGSTLSLDHLSSNVRSSTFAGKGGHLSSSNLFYSPTAPTGSGPDLSGTRNSSYLPAGYYAAGASTPGSGSGMTHLGAPQPYGYSKARSRGPSPPVSPSLSPGRGENVGYSRPSHSAIPSHGSTSSLNLSAHPQGRAPSAYLEDLFENHQSHPGGQDRY